MQLVRPNKRGSSAAHHDGEEVPPTMPTVHTEEDQPSFPFPGSPVPTHSHGHGPILGESTLETGATCSSLASCLLLP